MRQVSIKVRLDTPIEAMLPLKQAGQRFEAPFKQFDRVFLPNNFASQGSDLTRIATLTIRTNQVDNQLPEHSLILKRPLNLSTTMIYKTPVIDYSQTAHIINYLGYELEAEVLKHRQRLIIGDVTFYLDEIAEHGWFLKVERGLSDQGYDTKDLMQILESLDLASAEVAPRYHQIVKLKRS